MEAKGCAKASVWKDARRRFYWLLRARLARSKALSQLEEANPETTVEYRSQLLTTLTHVEGEAEMQQIAETMEKVDLGPTLSRLRSEHIMSSLRKAAQHDRKATVLSLIQLVDEMTEDEKASVLTAVQNRGVAVIRCDCAITF